MKKKINGLSTLIIDYIENGHITIMEVFRLCQPYLKICFGDPTPDLRGFRKQERDDGTKYERKTICVVEILVKKNDRKKIKRILSNSMTDNQLTFFYHVEYNEEGDQISKEIHFMSNRKWRWKHFRLYDFLYEFRKLKPNLLIDLEMMMMERI